MTAMAHIVRGVSALAGRHAGAPRHRTLLPAAVARGGRHRRPRLCCPRTQRAGRAHPSPGGCARDVRQGARRLQGGPGLAARADHVGPTNAEPSRAGPLSRPHPSDEHLQGSHRRAALAHRPAQQVRCAAGLLRRRHRAADRGVRKSLPHPAGAAGGRAELRELPSRMSSTSRGASRAPRASMRKPPTRRAASVLGCSLPRRTASRTSATGAPTRTRGACRRACRRIERAAGSGRRSSRGLRRSIQPLPPATTGKRRAWASATRGSITGPGCATV